VSIIEVVSGSTCLAVKKVIRKTFGNGKMFFLEKKLNVSSRERKRLGTEKGRENLMAVKEVLLVKELSLAFGSRCNKLLLVVIGGG
jgi:hypothetical protein